MYMAASAIAAVGETFAHLGRWTHQMLTVPAIPGARRRLVTYELDEERHPFIDLDDARILMRRGLRPSRVVARNRPFTHNVAKEIFAEGTWAGISWWSMHRPQWTLHGLFGADACRVVSVEDLAGHPGLLEAASRLAKVLDDALGSR